jgi:uncharacterized protein YjbI with pentapeptide repeats
MGMAVRFVKAFYITTVQTKEQASPRRLVSRCHARGFQGCTDLGPDVRNPVPCGWRHHRTSRRRRFSWRPDARTCRRGSASMVTLPAASAVVGFEGDPCGADDGRVPTLLRVGGRAVGRAWIMPVGLVAAVIVIGVVLALLGTAPWDGFGQALLSGGIIGAVFVIVEHRLGAASERTARRDALVRQLVTTTDLPGIDLAGQDLRELYLPGRKLTHARFDGADLSGAQLYFADLELASLVEVSARAADLGGSNLRLASVRNADLSGAKVDDCNLTSADLHGVNLTGASLEGSVLIDSDLTAARLVDCDLRGAQLTGADLRSSQLSGALLEGVTYDETTRWPEGFEPSPPSPPGPVWDPETNLQAWLTNRRPRTRSQGRPAAEDGEAGR